MSRFSFLPLFLVLLSLPAAAGIVAGPEHAVSAPALEPAAFDQERGRIASDGNGFLVVFGNRGTIDGVRVSSQRKRIDETPLVIAGTGDYEFDPDVAFGRDRYLVVWQWDDGIRGRMVSPDGTMAEPFDIVTGTSIDAPQVAFNGEVFLVVWTAPNERETHGALVDLDGRAGPPLRLGQGGLSFTSPQVTAAGDTFYVATWLWETQSLGLIEVASDGTFGAPIVVASEDDRASHFALGAQGDEVVVAWNDGNTSEVTPIRGVIVGDGEPRRFEFAERGRLRTIVSDSAGVWILYALDHEYARRLGSNDTYILPVPLPSAVNDGVSNGNDAVIVAGTYVDDGDLYLESVGRSDVELLTSAPRYQFGPRIAVAGDQSLVVWRESTKLLAARTDAHGVGKTIEIAGDLPRYWLGIAEVASNGSEWLVVWGEESRLVGVRVSASGEVGQRFVIATDVFGAGFSVAWDGSAYVVAFLRGIIGNRKYITNVFATRVLPDGTVRGEVQLSTTSNNSYPDIAASANAAVVAWHDSGSVRGALLSPSGTVTPLGILEEFVSDVPTVAWNGSTFLVVTEFPDELRWLTISETGVITRPPNTAAIPLASFGEIDVTPFGARFLLLAHGSVAIIDPRGWASELVPVTPDINARISGTTIAYMKAIEPAWPDVTRVFVRSIAVEPNAPRRRSVR